MCIKLNQQFFHCQPVFSKCFLVLLSKNQIHNSFASKQLTQIPYFTTLCRRHKGLIWAMIHQQKNYLWHSFNTFFRKVAITVPYQRILFLVLSNLVLSFPSSSDLHFGIFLLCSFSVPFAVLSSDIVGFLPVLVVLSTFLLLSTDTQFSMSCR